MTKHLGTFLCKELVLCKEGEENNQVCIPEGSTVSLTEKEDWVFAKWIFNGERNKFTFSRRRVFDLFKQGVFENLEGDRIALHQKFLRDYQEAICLFCQKS